ncbi:holo-ACP synthase [Albibacterium bauzanense]|uniref:Holo-[acyl-carrier protein] synthase n=1 Tax=Albibacterium bauzanense TaxID=653929 RepID=A0A4R1LQY2_9SPHI|nr:4'-phosphopantetheinyl transferase superfamily protein [Albibacterium bauzanense]TCK80620.1 holo-[acyl-carrier protein] synthase [Albibacterium bauzanense]
MKNKVFDAITIPLVSEESFSVGNDIVFLPDFILSFNPMFQKKIYTSEEILYCDQFDKPMLRYASTWAAKEAIYKSIKQLCPTPIGLSKITIIRDKIAGIPRVVLPASFSHLKVSLSITHDGDYVWAIAISKISSV